MNPVELPNATDPGQPPVLAREPEDARLALLPSRPAPFPPVTPSGRAGLLHAAVLGVLALELLPFLILLLTSLGDGFYLRPAALGMGPIILRTLFVAGLTTAGTLAFGLLAACFLARFHTPASAWLWRGYLGLLLLPAAANVVPLVPLLAGMHLADSLWALVLLGVAGGQAVAVCVLRQAIDGIPKSLFLAAEIDCVSPWQQIRHVVLPACAPVLCVLAILSFVGSWNEFLLPSLLLRQDRFTVGAALTRISLWASGGGKIAMADYLLVSLPVIFLGMWTLRTFMRALTNPFART